MLGASLGMTGVAIALLSVYGADVIYAETTGTDGFLPFDHKARGIGLGGPSVILPIIAFFISRKEPSGALAAMIIASGALIIAGGAAVMALADPAQAAESARNPAAEGAPLLAVGAFIVFLGAIKARKR